MTRRIEWRYPRPGELPELLLGRSGKLRPPTIRNGRRMLVGRTKS